MYNKQLTYLKFNFKFKFNKNLLLKKKNYNLIISEIKNKRYFRNVVL